MSDMLRQAQPQRCYSRRKHGDQEGVYLITAADAGSSKLAHTPVCVSWPPGGGFVKSGNVKAEQKA
ncbi:hypothetical protein JOQ06_027327, partial [Pogonophryne albipinna]